VLGSGRGREGGREAGKEGGREAESEEGRATEAASSTMDFTKVLVK